LGLEALSRGASQVTFVERDATAAREVRARLAEWGAVGARVEQVDAMRFLNGPAETFDIVFLDPPFASDLVAQTSRLLQERSWLAADALIYVETEAHAGIPGLPDGWKVTKAKQAGAVGYYLLMSGASGE
jgi:16S rRNA (guanine966-N2)-methyltransferase